MKEKRKAEETIKVPSVWRSEILQHLELWSIPRPEQIQINVSTTKLEQVVDTLNQSYNYPTFSIIVNVLIQPFI